MTSPYAPHATLAALLAAAEVEPGQAHRHTTPELLARAARIAAGRKAEDPDDWTRCSEAEVRYRSIRVPARLLDRANEVAKANGTTLGRVIVVTLARYAGVSGGE